jgi:hypothetical protein
MRYVEENPVRAGMVVNPGAYRWSSYPANALGKRGFDYDWLLPHPLYEALGRDADSRRQAYRRLFRAAMNEPDLKAIRDRLHKGAGPQPISRRDRAHARGHLGKPRDEDHKLCLTHLLPVLCVRSNIS